MATELASNAYLQIDKTSPAWSLMEKDLNTVGDKLLFQGLEDDITEGGGEPEWSEVTILGRSEPYLVYANTSGREIPLTLGFFAEGDYKSPEDIQSEESVLKEVVDKARWCQALRYPSYDPNLGGEMRPPPRLIFSLGKLYQGLTVLVTSAQVTWSAPWTFDTAGLTLQYPMKASVEMTLRVINVTPLGATDIMHGRSSSLFGEEG